jgi:glutamine amidotransferase
MTIAIVNYGVGNLGSILNIMRKIGFESYVCDSPDDIDKADKLILPGVGAFDSGMEQLNRSGFVPVLNDMVLIQKRPVLGICLGMQIMTSGSQEGALPGLNWIHGSTQKFSFDVEAKLRVPHMGWNSVYVQKESSLFEPNDPENRFYFVHSYHVVCNDENDIVTTTPYGINFTSSFHKDNIYGVQFHPEKSHRFGFQLLKKFAEL